MRFYDNSRISDHRLCNRYFYWRHERGLAPLGANFKADFGTCWSHAQDVVWTAVLKHDWPDNVVVEMALDRFVEEWKKLEHPLCDEQTPEQMEHYRFYHEQTAFAMLHEYLPRRRSFMNRCEIVATEWPFAVHICDDVYHTGRIDKVLRWEGRIWGMDHKSTAWYRRSGGFAPEWVDSWHMKTQPDAYLYALRTDFGPQAKGVIIDGALVHKDVREFCLIPIDKTPEMLEDWLWRTQHELTLMDANRRNLMHPEAPNAPCMYAFPKNDNSCIQYMKPCPYFDLCTSIPNPASDSERVPNGFHVQRWAPFDEDALRELVEKKNA